MDTSPAPRPVMPTTLGPACDPEAVAEQLLALAWGEDGIRDQHEALAFIREGRKWAEIAHTTPGVFATKVSPMPKIYFFIRDPDDLTRYRMATARQVELSRVPSVGEYVSLGNDTAGVAADYEVVFVHHAAGRPNNTDAEVYLNRVDLIAVKRALGAKGPGVFDCPSTAFPEAFD